MTPKEKAEVLIVKFSSQLPYYSKKDNEKKSIKCALFAVNEILEIHENAADIFELDRDLQLNENSWNYWLKVKQEIEKL